VTDDNFGQDWDGRNFPECSKEVLHCVFRPVGYEVLYVIWVMYLSMSYQHSQGVPLDDSLLAEGVEASFPTDCLGGSMSP